MSALLGEEVKCRVWQSEKPLGEGNLVISEDEFKWKSGDEQFELKYTYPEISIHAISRDFSVFPHECLYILIIHESAESEGEDDPSEEDELHSVEDGDEVNGVKEESLSSIEVRVVPEDLTKLSEMYSTISYCQGLHPDPDMSSDSEEALVDSIVFMLYVVVLVMAGWAGTLDMDHDMLEHVEGGDITGQPQQDDEEGQYDDVD